MGSQGKLPKNLKTIRLTVGAMIKVVRESRLLSHAELARIIGEGASKEQIKGYEAGETDISAATLFKIAEVLRYKIDIFFDAYYNPEDYPSLESME